MHGNIYRTIHFISLDYIIFILEIQYNIIGKWMKVFWIFDFLEITKLIKKLLENDFRFHPSIHFLKGI